MSVFRTPYPRSAVILLVLLLLNTACASAMVINEIHADPDFINGDANGDGNRDGSNDEFVEIVNDSDSTVDISSWTLSDTFGPRHTFPNNTIIPPHCAIVIFGGGLPSGSFGGAIVQTASSGSLGLNNSGDSVVLNDDSTDQATESYGTEGGDNQSLTRSPDITGSFVTHSIAAGSGGSLYSPGTHVDGSRFSGCFSCGDPATRIHTIQESGLSSSEDGNFHTIEGVVVGDFQTSSNLQGFFVQEEDGDVDSNPETSEGIFVSDGASPSVDVSVGSVVRVKGYVDEYNEQTILTNIASVQTCPASGTATPAVVSLPVADINDWERYEGMLIHISQKLYVTDNYNLGRYGEVGLSVNNRLYQPTNATTPGYTAIGMQVLNDRSRIQLDDGRSVQYPTPTPYLGHNNTLRTGDSISNLIGVLGYSYGSFELHPTDSVSFSRVNNRSDTPPAVGGSLKTASFNLLNYFFTLDSGSMICGPSANLSCRGADNATEFARQRQKIISAIVAMDADVTGLLELENHPADSALKDLVDGLNNAAGTGTYAYLDTGVVGVDAIKVGIIYQPATVLPVGTHAILDSSVNPAFIDTRNRPAIAQTFEEIATGERFTLTVNHFKSKGSNCDDLGDPDTGDGQGNCNLTRTNAATALVNWLATDPTDSNDPDFLIIGDLNAYAMEDPLSAIKNAGYTNLLEHFIGGNGYSFIIYGQSGCLDHALATASLTSHIRGVAQWHINSDEPSILDYNDHNLPAGLYSSDQYRSSDHDPVIVGLDLANLVPTASAFRWELLIPALGRRKDK